MIAARGRHLARPGAPRLPLPSLSSLRKRLPAAAAILLMGTAAYAWACGIAEADGRTAASFVALNRCPGLVIAEHAEGPWFALTAPVISEQIGDVARRLVPGSAGSMVVLARNTGSVPGVASISLTDLVDSGGAYPEPEREAEPGGDVGSLSANVVLTISYSSTQRAQGRPIVVARGTLRELATGQRVISAPVPLQPFAARGAETGVWTIGILVPTSADNRIQGDKTVCSFVFGLSQAR